MDSTAGESGTSSGAVEITKGATLSIAPKARTVNSYPVTENELQTVDTFYLQANRAYASAAFFAGLGVSTAVEAFALSDVAVTAFTYFLVGSFACMSVLSFMFARTAMKGRKSLIATVKEESTNGA